MAVKWSCSFCGHDQDDVGRIIAGPRVFICDICVRSCAENFSGGIPATAPFLENRPRYSTNNVHGPDALCSFCGKRWDDVQWVVKGPHEELICAECVWLTIQIINEAPPSGPTVRVRARDRSWRAWLRWPWPTRHMDKATRL